MQNLKPMEAVAALYSDGDPKTAEAIVASLSDAIFDGSDIRPARGAQRIMARASYRLLRLTTRTRMARDEAGSEGLVYTNRLLERSGHPYARAMLASSRTDMASLVEGGDPMNGPYMMISPEIRRNSDRWDRILFNSVQGRDVRLRFAWETRATYEASKRRLEKGLPVRVKAVAAGTGLSLIVAYTRLIRDGFDPSLITALVTDREKANIDKTNRLLAKLAVTRERRSERPRGSGISAATEDIFPRSGKERAPDPERFNVVTAIGILEYFQGGGYASTAQRLGIEPSPAPVTAADLARRLDDMTAEAATLIINTYRDDVSTRILELFGKRFYYRRREDVRSLLATVNFRPLHLVGSGNVYDVEVYEKQSLRSTPGVPMTGARNS